jgi:hypothetical protein
MTKVFFDTNSGDRIGGYLLIFDASKDDLKKMGSSLKDGSVVTLYMTDEVEVEATLRFDEQMNCWRGIPIGEFRDLSGLL